MKSVYFLVLISTMLLLLCCSEKNSTEPTTTISLEQAEQILISEVLNDSISDAIRVYELEEILEKDSIISSWKNQYTAEADCWFFFIDDAFYANWAHPCRYVFVFFNNKSGNNFEIIDETTPPNNYENLVKVSFY